MKIYILSILIFVNIQHSFAQEESAEIVAQANSVSNLAIVGAILSETIVWMNNMLEFLSSEIIAEKTSATSNLTAIGQSSSKISTSVSTASLIQSYANIDNQIGVQEIISFGGGDFVIGNISSTGCLNSNISSSIKENALVDDFIREKRNNHKESLLTQTHQNNTGAQLERASVERRKSPLLKNKLSVNDYEDIFNQVNLLVGQDNIKWNSLKRYSSRSEAVRYYLLISVISDSIIRLKQNDLILNEESYSRGDISKILSHLPESDKLVASSTVKNASGNIKTMNDLVAYEYFLSRSSTELMDHQVRLQSVIVSTIEMERESE